MNLGKTLFALRGLAMDREFWRQFDAENAVSGEAPYWHATALLASGNQRLAQPQFVRAAPLLNASTWPSHQKLAAQIKKQNFRLLMN